MVCNTVNERSKQEKRFENSEYQTSLINPFVYITMQVPESKKGTKRLQKNPLENTGKTREKKNRYPGYFSRNKREFQMKEQYKSKLAPARSSLSLERNSFRKERTPEQCGSKGTNTQEEEKLLRDLRNYRNSKNYSESYHTPEPCNSLSSRDHIC